ncbi:AAA family ATPase [Streptococcus salivarius]|uniref:AAA family ATPase n=1 Tax=Streptococcus salivarius TaxID=1304 RepID=UPI0032195B65
MKVNKIECNFIGKSLNIEFNRNLNGDNNTYSLILGDNGSGKSLLFEAILSYFSKEYDRQDIQSSIDIDGELKKIILSTYSPYDRIRTKMLREKSKVFFKINLEKSKPKNDIPIIYPNHHFDEFLSLVSSSYFKCKINDKAHFKKVEKGLSRLINFNSESIFLLIESINQAKISKLFHNSRSFNDNHLFEKVSDRLELLDYFAKKNIEGISKLLIKKKSLFDQLIGESENLNIDQELFKKIIMEYFLQTFNDFNCKSDQFLEKINIKLREFRLDEIEREKFNSIIFKLIHLRKNLLSEIRSLVESMKLNFTKVEYYLLKCDLPEQLELFIVLIILKKTYQEIKSRFGVMSTYESNTKQYASKQILKIDDLKYYYSEKFKEKDINTVINLDFDILQLTDNFLIDDLIITKNEREMSISQFSSGELSLFIRILEISLHIENNSLILIDEPEIHLNPLWINNYYYLLKECFSDLNCHFIIASQSPLMVGMFNKSQIFYLKSEFEAVKVVEIEEETYAGSIDSILDFVFGVNYRNNPLVEQEIISIKDMSSKDLIGAIDRVNQIAYSLVRNQLISDILTKENIAKYEELLEGGE